EPVAARACDREPIALPPGRQELLVSPGDRFVVDGAQLLDPTAPESPGATTVPAAIGRWDAARREVHATASSAARVLVVPESINPGWAAHGDDGTRLTPVAVNGWQQGFVL